MLSLLVGMALLILITTAALGYLRSATTDHYDRIGAYVFFIVAGLPVGFVGLLLIISCEQFEARKQSRSFKFPRIGCPSFNAHRLERMSAVGT